MKRYAGFIVLLAFSICAAAQSAQPGSSQNTVVPAAVAPVVVAGPGGLSTNTGTAVIIAPPSAPLIVTPEVHLTTMVPTIGATNATPGNKEGAANATAAMPVPPRVVTNTATRHRVVLRAKKNASTKRASATKAPEAR